MPPFTRHGGVSKEPYGTLNLSIDLSDDHEAVKTNREQVRKHLGLSTVVYPHQKHGNVVQRITAKNLDQDFNVDALFTTEKNVGLAVQHADCQAANFYDPVHEAIAIVHCGWKGSVQKYLCQSDRNAQNGYRNPTA